jgi:pyrimidine-specific ribonucleoside hydrolase
MDMIIETDVGHDPDDFFTICYLAAVGVNIRAICITPGDKDQLAIAGLLRKELNLDIPIGYSKESGKYSVGGVHAELLRLYGYSKDGIGDGWGKDIIKDVFSKYADANFFIIGPPSSTGRFLEESDVRISKLTMQGGFLGYDLHPHAQNRLSQFAGKTWMPTFNMNGDRKGTASIMEADIVERRFCGKNVCHGVFFTRDRMPLFHEGRSKQLFVEAGDILFRKHEAKKFHDPVAAVCHLHPEVGTWVRGKVQKMESGWGTVLDGNGDYVLAELDHDKFWEHIENFT